MTYKIEVIIYPSCFVHNLYKRKWFFSKWHLVDKIRSESAWDELVKKWVNECKIPEDRITFKRYVA